MASADAAQASMPIIQPCEVPRGLPPQPLPGGAGFADCYVTEVPGAISQAAFIEAFYTSPLFKVERTILKYFVAKPATDADARQLAEGVATRFSAWNVEGQSRSELLLSDLQRSHEVLAHGVADGRARSLVQHAALLWFCRRAAPTHRNGQTGHGLALPCIARVPSPVFTLAAACGKQASAASVTRRRFPLYGSCTEPLYYSGQIGHVCRTCLTGGRLGLMVRA